jgi:hypothetical protein
MPVKLDRQPLARRTFLRGAGITLALPWLDAMSLGARAIATAGTIAPDETPRRAVFCMFGLGINGRDFTPAETGQDYTLTPILEPLEALRRDFTVISGMKLTYSGGHTGDRTFLTGTNTRSPAQNCASLAIKSWPRPSAAPPVFRRWPWGSSAARVLAAITIKRCRGARAARRFRRKIVRMCCSINYSVPKRPTRSIGGKPSSCAAPACSTRSAARPTA